MAGPASYPDNLAVRVTALERLAERLLYAAQAREPFTRLIARGMVVGNDSPERRILFNPETANPHSAEIWMFPQTASDSNPAKIIVDESATYPGEAVLTMTSGASASASTLFRMASGEVFMQVLDETGTSDNGGFAYWGRTHAQFGFVNGSGGDNYFNFSSNSLSRHFGQWDDFGSQPSNSGLLWGSVTTSSGNSYTISYPASMDSNMGPIIGFRPANTTPISWQITASNSSSMSIGWSGSAQSAGIYMVSFRH